MMKFKVKISGFTKSIDIEASNIRQAKYKASMQMSAPPRGKLILMDEDGTAVAERQYNKPWTKVK